MVFYFLYYLYSIDGKSDVLVAGTTKGYIPVYNMRYPLLVNCWQQSDHSAITHMVLGQE